MFKVPSVEPAKYESVGYGRIPCRGWNSAAVGACAAAGVRRATLPILASVAPTVPWPPEHARGKSGAATAAAIISLSVISLVLLAELQPVPPSPVLLIVVAVQEPV